MSMKPKLATTNIFLIILNKSEQTKWPLFSGKKWDKFSSWTSLNTTQLKMLTVF